MWFQTVDTTVRASLLQYVLSFSLAAAQLISMATFSVQLKIKTTQEIVLHCNSSSVSNATLLGEPRMSQAAPVMGQYLYFLTCIQPHLCAFQYLITFNSQKKPSPNIDVHSAPKPQKCCI